MHDQHSEETNNCYQCHPGPTTQCLRGTMATDFGLVGQNCHGSVLNVAETIKNGRQPWFQEPRCGDCHGSTYAEEPNTLYRNSKGHGNLYCPTCHNSPHAILPTREPLDNVQVTALQGHAGTLVSCDVCHGYTPSGAGLHGLVVTGVADGGFDEGRGAQIMPALNPFRSRTEIQYRVVDGSPIQLAVFDASGRRVRVLTAAAQTPGRHTLVWGGRNDAGTPMPAGVYFARITTGGRTATARMVKLERWRRGGLLFEGPPRTERRARVFHCVTTGYPGIPCGIAPAPTPSVPTWSGCRPAPPPRPTPPETGLPGAA